MEPQLYFCYKRGNVVDTSKNILPFPCMEMVRWCNQNEVAEAMFPRNKLAKIFALVLYINSNCSKMIGRNSIYANARFRL